MTLSNKLSTFKNNLASLIPFELIATFMPACKSNINALPLEIIGIKLSQTNEVKLKTAVVSGSKSIVPSKYPVVYKLPALSNADSIYSPAP